MDLIGFEGAELVEDVSPAQWIHESLWEPWSGNGFRVGSVVPPVFEAYARIFHPPVRYHPRQEQATWSEVARRNGRTPHSLMQWRRIAVEADPQWQVSVGELEEAPTRILASLLRPSSSTPEVCWYAIWVGLADWWGEGQPLMMLPPGTDIEAFLADDSRFEMPEPALDPRIKRRKETLQQWPTVSTGADRGYFLFRGDALAAASLMLDGWRLTANLWWPDDRAWCVATEIDYDSTIVGGSRECIDAILASSDLEALQIGPEDRLDVNADELNPLPPDEDDL